MCSKFLKNFSPIFFIVTVVIFYSYPEKRTIVNNFLDNFTITTAWIVVAGVIIGAGFIAKGYIDLRKNRKIVNGNEIIKEKNKAIEYILAPIFINFNLIILLLLILFTKYMVNIAN